VVVSYKDEGYDTVQTGSCQCSEDTCVQEPSIIMYGVPCHWTLWYWYGSHKHSFKVYV